jgi:hypoxanthine phosphoribosyltransferase
MRGNIATCREALAALESRFRRGKEMERKAKTSLPKKRRFSLFAGENVRMLLTRGQIQKRIGEMGRQIRQDFPGEPLILVGVLKGAVLFLADLSRQIGGEVTFDFIAVSSYGKEAKSSGQVKLNKDLDASIEGKSVIVVEDILDTGLTLQYLLRILEQRKPKHLRIAALLEKPERRIAAVHADYVGFTIPNEFVVGYGLDYAERYRNLPDVGILSFSSNSQVQK